MTAKKPPEPKAPENVVAVEQAQLSDSAELWTSATVAFTVRGSNRYVKVELKESALVDESFDDLSYRSIDAVREHLLRVVDEITDITPRIEKIARSA